MSSRRCLVSLLALTGSALLALRLGRFLGARPDGEQGLLFVAGEPASGLDLSGIDHALAQPPRVRHARFVRELMDVEQGRSVRPRPMPLSADQVAAAEFLAARSAQLN